MKNSFKKGLGQVQTKDIKTVKAELKAALKINSRTSWYERLNGNIEPKKSEADEIESIFLKYGITEIWGE